MSIKFFYATRNTTLYNLTPTNMPKVDCLSFSAGDLYDHKETLKQAK